MWTLQCLSADRNPVTNLPLCFTACILFSLKKQHQWVVLVTTLSGSPSSPPQVLPVLSRKTTALLLESCARQTESMCDVFNITQLKSSSMLQTNTFEDTLRRSSNIIAWSLIVLFNYVKTIWMSQCDRLQPHLWHANTYLWGSTLCKAQQKNILHTNISSSQKQ